MERTLKEIIHNNKYYFKLLGGIILAIIFANSAIIHFSENPNYSLIGKTWVIGSSILTAFYTRWFWFKKGGKGRKVLGNIKDTTDSNPEDSKVVDCSLTIGASVILLFVIAIINFLSLWDVIDNIVVFKFSSWGSISLSHLNVFFTLLLMIITCLIFCSIDKKIIDIYGKEEKGNVISRDFENTLVNIDRPGILAYVFLSIYFIAILYFTKNTMELFFYGAIASQMLFSSIITANMEVTDIKQPTETNE